MSDAVISVHLFAAARAAVGADRVDVPAATLGEVVAHLVDQYPRFASVAPQCSYLVDSLAVHGDPASVELAPGTRVDILPPFAGG
jgi:molybdopterin synthase sulfur carrier subunit